ncbi:MAG: PDZ domain-containing protein, partial [Acidobacteria bacterium]|nr:PDZ domain-containing protein [Acidobacteriota bacterium]
MHQRVIFFAASMLPGALLAGAGVAQPLPGLSETQARLNESQVRMAEKQLRLQVAVEGTKLARELLQLAQNRRLSREVVIAGAAGGSYLGVGVADIDAERAKALNLKEERGVEVKSVDEDSPAAKAGLKEGDLILEYNGQLVEGTEQLVRLVRETPPGRSASLQISRGGATQALTATIGSRKSRRFVSGGVDEDFRFEVPGMPPMVFDFDWPAGDLSWRSSRLGIETVALGDQLAEYFGVKAGVLVRAVKKDSAAERAGIKAGDVIVQIDGAGVSRPQEISKA